MTLPFGTFLSLLPPMRPRQYSISSSPASTPTHATLTYSVLEAPALANPTRNTHRGVATSFLASLAAGDKLLVSVRPTHTAFRPPPAEGGADETTTPIICAAAGAGLAPFRGFVQERAARLLSSSCNPGRRRPPLAPPLLFFGCRAPRADDLYRDEFDAWQAMGAVDVRRAFSRVATTTTAEAGEARGCRHVQDRIWRDREEVSALWERGARVYVCGSRQVGDAVRRVMGRIVLGDGATEEEITQWYAGVRNDRYATDVFD